MEGISKDTIYVMTEQVKSIMINEIENKQDNKIENKIENKKINNNDPIKLSFEKNDKDINQQVMMNENKKQKIELSERFKIYNAIETFKPFQVELMEQLANEKKIGVSVGTGIGKTTMMKYISLDFIDLDPKNKCLIIVNTRALSFDIQSSINEILEDDEQGIICNLCNYNIKNQITSSIIQKARIIITTPVKYIKLINKLPTTFTFVCIDEIDALLDNQNIEESAILSILNKISYQYSLICTATMTEDVYKYVFDKYGFISKNFNEAIPNIEIQRIMYNKKIKDWYIPVCDKIYYILSENMLKKKALVFCNYRNDCELLYNEYKRTSPSQIFCIHGNMPSEQIQNYYNQYKTNGKILFTTDMCQRGLDIKDIDIVFHIGTTNNYDFYHRNGRTLRRSGATPLCFIFTEEGDMSNELICSYKEKRFDK